MNFCHSYIFGLQNVIISLILSTKTLTFALQKQLYNGNKSNIFGKI